MLRFAFIEITFTAGAEIQQSGKNPASAIYNMRTT